jgi:hypothetical protein
MYQAVWLPLVGQKKKDLCGSSLGGQGGVKVVTLFWLNQRFISCGESLLAKKKSACE